MLPGIDKTKAIIEELNIEGMDYLDLLNLRLRINNATTKHENAAYSALNRGERVPGFRLKKGRKTRSVDNSTTLLMAATEKFHLDRDAFFTEKMIGIPAIEKLLEAQGHSKDRVAVFLADHITSKFSDPTLEFVGA